MNIAAFIAIVIVTAFAGSFFGSYFAATRYQPKHRKGKRVDG